MTQIFNSRFALGVGIVSYLFLGGNVQNHFIRSSTKAVLCYLVPSFSGVSMGFLWDSYGPSMGFLLGFLWDFYDISMGIL